METSERAAEKAFEAKKAKTAETLKAEKLMVLHQRLRLPQRLWKLRLQRLLRLRKLKLLKS